MYAPDEVPNDPGTDLWRRVEALERAFGELGSADLLRTAGVVAERDILRILGSLLVDGTLRVTGNTRIEGTLDLPAGIIGNDALANPLDVVGAATVTAGLWAVGTSMGSMATTSITVPEGFSQAFVMAQASMHFQDSAPNGAWVRAAIGASAGGEMGGLANLNLGQSAFHGAPLTGLSGGDTIALACQVRASVASAVTTGRIAQIAGFGVFFR